MMMMATTTKASSNVGVREKHRRRHYLSRLQKSRHQCRRDKVAVTTRAKNGDEDVEEATTGRNTRWLRRAFKTYRKISQDGVQIPTADDLSSGVQKSLNKRNVSLPEVPDVEDVKELMTRDPRELIPEIEVPELEDVVEDAKPFLAKLADGVKRSFAKRNIKVPKIPTSVEEVKETIAEKTKVVKVPEVPDPRALAEGVKKSIVKRKIGQNESADEGARETEIEDAQKEEEEGEEEDIATKFKRIEEKVKREKQEKIEAEQKVAAEEEEEDIATKFKRIEEKVKREKQEKIEAEQKVAAEEEEEDIATKFKRIEEKAKREKQEKIEAEEKARIAAEEEEARIRAEEEEKARIAAEEEEARIRAEEEEKARIAAEEEEARIRAEEEEKARIEAELQAAEKLRADEEAAAVKMAEAARIAEEQKEKEAAAAEAKETQEHEAEAEAKKSKREEIEEIAAETVKLEKARAEKAAAKIAMAGHFARMKKNENEKATRSGAVAEMRVYDYTITGDEAPGSKEENFENKPPTPPSQTQSSGNSKEASPEAPEVQTKVYEETMPNSDNIQLFKCVTTQRLKFEVEYALKRGTSDNVYSIEGTEKTALIDVPDKAFAENLFGKNKHSSSDFLILQHISPKRLDSISALLENRSDKLPPIEIVVTNPGARVIYDALKPPDGVTPGSNERLIAAWKRPSELSGKPKLRARLRIIRGSEEKLDLGGGRTLTFMPCSTPRWPDVFCTRDSKSGIVFTSKFYSAHTANEQTDENNNHVETYDSGGLDSFQEDWRYFYDCMVAPMATQASTALFKLKALAYNSPYKQPRLAPCHGPVLLNSSPELMREYDEWTDKQLKQINNVSVAVIYASAYGNTSAMAQAIARGITKAGVGVEMVNCELTSADEIQELAKTVGGFCLGSPTLGGHVPTPVTDAMGQIVKKYDTDKPAGVFGSFGWSGEAVDIMETRLKNAGFNFAFDAIRCKFKPTEEILQLCEESGTDLAQLVLKKSKQMKKAESKRVQAETFASVTETEAAVGRIVGSLCAVTAKNGDAQSAMLASWVSQASFNPPSITVAVAKDRAVESFMLPGGNFNLNILKLGNEKETMKALLKGFAPGEDRFGDMTVSYSENNECAIVTDALAYCECAVKSRMECGDHWVVLAEVTGGKLLDEEGKSAMHHRKTGKSY